MRVGRNDLCPCGSGKKFKRCHLASRRIVVPPQPPMPIPNALPPGLLKRATEQFEKQRLDEENRVKTFGDVRPIMYVPNFHGTRFIAVREKIYPAPEKSTFTNFLFNHGLITFGE